MVKNASMPGKVVLFFFICLTTLLFCKSILFLSCFLIVSETVHIIFYTKYIPNTTR